MKIKIIKQFGAAVAALLIVYGTVATTYRSYEQVMAAQVEIPPAIVVKNAAADSDTESVVTTVAANTTTTEAATTETVTEMVPETTTDTTTMAVTAETTTPIVVAVTEPVETPAIVEAAPVVAEPVVTEPEPDVPSLSEYLSQFRCGGCGKNCSLLNPRCGVGNQKAQQTEAEYYATYS
ncbi:MAG: hypothetical protein BI182_04185 [Acetobacterium sp. MES1]|uniref:hypothetical protein n=1 Tax=Acetobacterium sp. MES1 TaxID=1899015 RepID=UPI000B9C8A4E|nr:hypothetical protein [Acetobacterium sp. MES1]OXS27223.1 MAG: hypothetical protein BI182_04185 [Acetobacterium sp. MES1]